MRGQDWWEGSESLGAAKYFWGTISERAGGRLWRTAPHPTIPATGKNNDTTDGRAGESMPDNSQNSELAVKNLYEVKEQANNLESKMQELKDTAQDLIRLKDEQGEISTQMYCHLR